MNEKCTIHNLGRKIKQAFSFSRRQWAIIAIVGLTLLAYLGYRRDQAAKAERVPVQKETGGIVGCVEATKQRNGSFKCVECEDGYRMSRGKCVKHK